jgi:Ni,Fe-hydrogenase III large subunit
MKGAETVTLPPDQLEAAARELLEDGGRMQMAYACNAEGGRIELRYLVSPADVGAFVVWRCVPNGDPPSLAHVWPLLGWYEREIMDLHGIQFTNHPEPNRLVLRGNVPPPLARHGSAVQRPAAPRDEDIPRALPDVSAGEVQTLPFGPVRADVLESAEFTFFYTGEHILHYQPHLFFKHRGMEERFEGIDPLRGVVLAERISGVGTVAHALAFCQAVEAACDCEVPARARSLRVLLAELERVYNHFHYLGHLANTTTLKVGEAEGKLLEERAKQINARLTGSRFLRSLLVPGGLRRDLAPADWLSGTLETLREQSARYIDRLERSDSHLDRLITTGRLTPKVVFDQGATGPVQRASGADRDLRRDHPYAAYGELPTVVPVRQDGDAYARSAVRAAELDASIALIQRVLLLLPDGPVRTECVPVPRTEGLGWSESPRGSLFYAVHFGGNGRFSRVKIKSPSFSNWRIFPSTVHDTNMMDYAINEASFGLTIAGCAR